MKKTNTIKTPYVIDTALAASFSLPNVRFILINLREEAELDVGNVRVNMIPAWKWLTDRKSLFRD